MNSKHFHPLLSGARARATAFIGFSGRRQGEHSPRNENQKLKGNRMGQLTAIHDLTEENEKLRAENAELKERVSELEKENFRLMEQVAALENRNEALTEEVERLKEENETLRQRLEQKENAGGNATQPKKEEPKKMSIVQKLNQVCAENDRLKAELAAEKSKPKVAATPKPTTPVVTKANAQELYSKIEGAKEREAFRAKYPRELGLVR